MTKRTTAPSARRKLRGALAGATRQRLKPPPKLTMSEWADRYRILSAEHAAEPGPWSTARAPYQRGIMDACSDPLVEQVVVMSCAQVGKTEMLNNLVGYYVDQDPAPILVVQPSLDEARKWSLDRLAPMLRDTPQLKGRVKESKSRDSGNTLLHKHFPGGRLLIVGANSPSGLSAHPIRVVLCDEVDRYPPSAGSEGDPVQLAAARTATFWNRKIAHFSTPTVKGVSRIEAEYERSDQRRYHVPCPHCTAMQALDWKNLRWEPGKPETAAMACVACGVLIEEPYKFGMLARGEWRAQVVGPKVAGFHLNQLYSPWRRWAELVTDFLKAKDYPELLRVWVNTTLGETWEEQAERVAGLELLERRETYPDEVPSAVGILTAGVDVQADRLEVIIRGWGAAEESWLVHRETLRGDTARPEVWQDLDRVLTVTRGGMTIAAACVDAGFRTEEVYRFVQPRQGRRVYATKGYAQPGRPVIGRITKPNRYGVKLVPIGADTAKDTLHARLRIDQPGPGYMHLPVWADAEYVQQLTAERVVTRYRMGRPIRVWVKDAAARNEALDCEVLAYAALVLLGPTTLRELGNLASRRAPSPSASQVTPPPSTAAQQAVRRVLKPPRRPGGWVGNW